MNWGYKIMFVYIAFVLVMLGMVYVASQQTNDMQDENYYVKELNYQDVISGKNNLNAIPDKVSILDSADVIRLKIPASVVAVPASGTIRFLKPSDKKKDYSIALNTTADGVQFIYKTALATGLYTVQLNWKHMDQLYYHEQSLNVEP
jgi:hypothetical protein